MSVAAASDETGLPGANEVQLDAWNKAAPHSIAATQVCSCNYGLHNRPGICCSPFSATQTGKDQDQQHSCRWVRTSFCVAVGALCGFTRLGRLLLCCQPGHGDLILPTLAHTAGAVGAHAVVRPQGAVTVDVDLGSKATAAGNQGSVCRQGPPASARHPCCRCCKRCTAC